jgi:hypothetical protein
VVARDHDRPARPGGRGVLRRPVDHLTAFPLDRVLLERSGRFGSLASRRDQDVALDPSLGAVTAISALGRAARSTSTSTT